MGPQTESNLENLFRDIEFEILGKIKYKLEGRTCSREDILLLCESYKFLQEGKKSRTAWEKAYRLLHGVTFFETTSKDEDGDV